MSKQKKIRNKIEDKLNILESQFVIRFNYGVQNSNDDDLLWLIKQLKHHRTVLKNLIDETPHLVSLKHQEAAVEASKVLDGLDV